MANIVINLIIFAIFISFFAIITTRVFSNYITQLTVYHKNEGILERIYKLYFLYMKLSVASIITTYFILSGNSFPDNIDTALLEFSIIISFIVPLVCRVAAVTKRPFIFDCKKYIDVKSAGKSSFYKLFKLHQCCIKDECPNKDEIQNSWNISKERISSFTYSIFTGNFVFILFIFLFSFIFVQGIENVDITIKFKSEDIRPYFNVILLSTFMPFVVTIVGEFFIKLLGGPSEFLAENNKLT